MSAQTYRNQQAGSSSVDQQVEASQSPAPGSSQRVDPAAQDQMWESRRAELVGDWLEVDPVTQAAVCDEMDISHVVNQGMLPHPSQIAEMVKRSHELQASGGSGGEGTAEAQLVEAKTLWVTSKARTEQATSRYRSYEQEAGDLSWGWAETQASEWFGGQELPDLALENSANEAIAGLDALNNQGEQAPITEVTQQMALVRSTVDAWAGAMQSYTESRESGGESSIDALRLTRDVAATTVATLAVPAGAGVAANVAMSAGSSAGFQGVTEVAAMEAGVQEEGAAQRIAMSGVKGGATAPLAGLIAKGAVSVLSARILPRVVASASSILGKTLSERMACEMVDKAIQIVAGVGLSEATPWLSEQVAPSIEDLVAYVDGTWGQTIVAQALDLAEEQEEAVAA